MKNKNLISISGPMGAGKDLTGKIIQYLTSGERMSYESFCLLKERWYNPNDYVIKKFATSLKQMASIMLGVPVEKFEDPAFKNQELGSEWTTYGIIRKGGTKQIAIQNVPHSPNSIWLKTEGNRQVQNVMTVRTFLQKLGTEAVRNNLHPNAWENMLFKDYTGILSDTGFTYPAWIITDTRFPNELQAVKDRNGITIEINRPSLSGPGGTISDVHMHPSETALDNAAFHYTIENDSDIPALIKKVRGILIEVGILNV